MILVKSFVETLKRFYIQVDEYAGVISILSNDRRFIEPMTFRFVKNAMLTVEVDYTDEHIQEIIFSYYSNSFDGLTSEGVEILNISPSIVVPKKNEVERHALYWNLDFQQTPLIFIGESYVDIGIEFKDAPDRIYRDGSLDIFVSDKAIVGFRLNELSESELELIQERLTINQRNE